MYVYFKSDLLQSVHLSNWIKCEIYIFINNISFINELKFLLE